MKAVAFNASVRKGGNTLVMIKAALAPLEAAGIETEIIELGQKTLQGCIACYKCFERADNTCALINDPMNEYIAKMLEADAIILGSPTYFADVTTNMKSLIDRCGMTMRANGSPLTRKIGAGVAVARRAGAMRVMDSINQFFFISGMIVPGSTYWNVGYGLKAGDVEQDIEGLETMKGIGENIAWLLEKTVD
ncbi:flavodoxin family protein [Maridesulfovibrio hydrothermalis]|uniref:NADPH-dependent FMN reductase n=1 Tax=Maridesulfovibrio hydrothermalis AM13 = DSM 14728 TaxID=1121451 RepID=L0RAW0_9BACT|nr:flavodoxin family protein [Maridesulfovibrio hydrothermalis]CCO23898.1 NADPH-dependent FMN reductase [Maridesulfovibrio hydrothermalis AM13 = DSM 14728]